MEEESFTEVCRVRGWGYQEQLKVAVGVKEEGTPGSKSGAPVAESGQLAAGSRVSHHGSE